MTIGRPQDILQSFKSRLFGSTHTASGIEYWRHRARSYGARSVLNLGHPNDDYSAVTRMQRETLFPLLKRRLTGNEKRLLDFGCGPGRFTVGLADLIGGEAVGIDPVQGLLALAAPAQNVSYRVMDEAKIPFQDAEFDIVWCCLVLGGITEIGTLDRTVGEMRRVLKPGGLLFLAENTSAKTDQPHWHFRSGAEYQSLFDFATLEHLADYDDLGETISVIAGRKA